jgi:serine/threonine protein kinase
MLQALDYLHSLAQPVSHRDVKPENILLFGSGVKLADFGSSCQGCHEASGYLCGTPEYMAPEVFANEAYDTKVDIWSLGILVYEMLLGRTPFALMIKANRYQDQHELMQAISEVVKVASSEQNDRIDYPDSVPPAAKDFIQSCLQRDPAKRPSALQAMSLEFVRSFHGCSQGPGSFGSTYQSVSKKINQKVLTHDSYEEDLQLDKGMKAPGPTYETEEQVSGQVKSRVAAADEMELYGNGKHHVLVSGFEDLRVCNEVIDLDQYSQHKHATPRIVNAVSSFKDYSNQTQKLQEIKNSRKESGSLQQEPGLSVPGADRPEPSVVEPGLKSFELLNLGRLAENSNEVE